MPGRSPDLPVNHDRDRGRVGVVHSPAYIEKGRVCRVGVINKPARIGQDIEGGYVEVV